MNKRWLIALTNANKNTIDNHLEQNKFPFRMRIHLDQVLSYEERKPNRTENYIEFPDMCKRDKTLMKIDPNGEVVSIFITRKRLLQMMEWNLN